MSEIRKVKLSLDKFIVLLEKNSYTISSVYCDKQNIRFVECRTPRQQKTFVVHLPEKYVMVYPKNKKPSLKRLDIASTNNPPSSRQIEFMSDMKGPLLDCDLVAISSETLCIYRNTNSAECFDIVDENSKSVQGEEVSDGESEVDEIANLEKDTLKVLKKVKGPQAKLPKATLPTPKKSPEEKISEKPQEEAKGSSEEPFTEESPDEEIKEGENEVQGEEEVQDENEVQAEEEFNDEEGEGEALGEEGSDPTKDYVELIFEDENGEPFDEVKSVLNSVKIKKPKRSKKSRSTKIESDEEDEEETHNTDNSLPPNIEEEDLVLGIIYVMIDIGNFFRKIAFYEDEVIPCYEQIDENELELRNKRLSKIREMTMSFLKHSEDRLGKISQEEKDLKVQLIRLTVVLAQAIALKARVSSKPENYGDVVDEAERIYKQTRTTIYDLNMELLKLRDNADELLSNYKSSIDDLMNM